MICEPHQMAIYVHHSSLRLCNLGANESDVPPLVLRSLARLLLFDKTSQPVALAEFRLVERASLAPQMVAS